MKPKALFAVIGLLLALGSPAVAQSGCGGQARPNTFCGNNTGSTRLPGFVPVSGAMIDVLAAGLKADGVTNNGPLLQSILDANPKATLVFPVGPSCYNIQGPIYLSDITGRNFSGTITGTGGCINFTNAGNAIDSEITTQRGFVAYPKVNGPSGDTTGIIGASITNINMTCPANGTCIHITNSQFVTISGNQINNGRWGIVEETNIDSKISDNRIGNFTNGGLGLLMLSDTSRVWYGNASNPGISYWNDGVVIDRNVFSGLIPGALGHIIDMGSESESNRTISSNTFFSGYTSGNDYGPQFGYVSRNANPTFIGANWSEGVAYPIRTYNSNASEGGGNLPGVTAAQPNGTYALSNFPDGFGYMLSVRGYMFEFGVNNINCSGVSICTVGPDIASSVSGYHIVASQGSNQVLDQGETVTSYLGGGAFSSITNGAVYANLNTLRNTSLSLVAPMGVAPLNMSGNAVVLAASASAQIFSSGSALLMIRENTSIGSDGVFLLNAPSGTGVQIGSGSTAGFSFTTTPAGASFGVGWNGSGFSIYNGTGATRTFSYSLIRHQ